MVGSPPNSRAVAVAASPAELFYDPFVDRDLAKLLTITVDQKPPVLRRSLTGAEAARVRSRVVALGQLLEAFGAAERDDVARALTMMMNGFRSMRGLDEDGAIFMIESIVRRLAIFPLWAIREACDRFGIGHAESNKRFAPNDSEIYCEVESVIRPYRVRLNRARALLEGEAPITREAAAARPPSTGGASCQADDIDLSPEQRRTKYGFGLADAAVT